MIIRTYFREIFCLKFSRKNLLMKFEKISNLSEIRKQLVFQKWKLILPGYQISIRFCSFHSYISEFLITFLTSLFWSPTYVPYTIPLSPNLVRTLGLWTSPMWARARLKYNNRYTNSTLWMLKFFLIHEVFFLWNFVHWRSY